jgi:6-phosphofructokinase 1
METATVVVTPAPVSITHPPQHKFMKSSPARKPAKKKLASGRGGYVLEDVPHLTDYLPELKVSTK